MKVTKAQVVTVVGFIMSSLLLVFATSCSFEKKTPDDSTLKQAKNNPLKKRQKKELLSPTSFAVHAITVSAMKNSPVPMNERVSGAKDVTASPNATAVTKTTSHRLKSCTLRKELIRPV